MYTEIGSIALALRASRSKRRPVKRGPNGDAKKRWYVQAWALTGTDAVGRFLGVNIGTPLQRKLSKLACLLFGVAVVFAIVCMAANFFSSNTEVIMYAVATGISMIPACLVVVLTITMAVGTKHMVKRNVIVRKLDSLEALGAVTDICSDKTGTLTQGKMVVKKAWIPSRGTYSVGTSNEPFNPTIGDVTFTPVPPLEPDDEKESPYARNPEGLVSGNRQLEDFLDVASMANLSHVYESEEGEWNARGEPTEIAIQVFASRFR
jgi:magnesium-transporting ATPase (P-type)